MIRGPASAVWGANALTGVVNVITKSPREMVGEQPHACSVGTFGRDADGVERSNGSLFSVSGGHAAAPSTIAGPTRSPPASRRRTRSAGRAASSRTTPTRRIRRSRTPGTSQPKFDVRVDYDFAGRRAEAGVRRRLRRHRRDDPHRHRPVRHRSRHLPRLRQGELQPGRACKLNAFVNHLDGDATNRLSRDATGQPFIPFAFKNTTFDVEASDVTHACAAATSSATAATSATTASTLSLAPRGDSRTEAGVYGQDEIFLSEHFRAVVGARVDKFSSIDGAVFSPRTTLHVQAGAGADGARLVQPRLSRAVARQQLPRRDARQRARSRRAQPGAGRAASSSSRSRAIGNEDLKEEKLTAYEIGYTAIVANRATVSAAFYVNDTDNSILFTPDRLVSRRQPAARLAAAAARARADRASRAASAPATACRRRSAT